MKRLLLRAVLLALPWLVFGAGPMQAATCENNIPASKPDAIYVNHGDGTVTDTRTGLVWRQCAEGQSGADCATGSAEALAWGAALARAEGATFAGYTDWRLPNVKELASLVEDCRVAPAINTNLFPNTPHWGFWSASPDASHSGDAWVVSFRFGGAWSGYNLRSCPNHDLACVNYVRLVRGGE